MDYRKKVVGTLEVEIVSQCSRSANEDMDGYGNN